MTEEQLEHKKIKLEAEPEDKKRASILLFVIAMVAVFSWLVYLLPVGNGFTSGVVRVIPYPSGRVNSSFLGYKTFLDRRGALDLFYTQDEEESPSDSVIDQAVMNAMIRAKIVSQLLRENGQRIDESSVDQFMTDAQAEFESDEAFSDWLENKYGWSIKQFKKFVAIPFAEAKALEEFVYDSPVFQERAHTRTAEALSRIENGERFDAIVLEYSEHESAPFNGGLGWMSVTELPEEWLIPATELDDGAVSGIIEGEQQFTILRLNDRVDKGDEVQINISIITISKDSLDGAVDQYWRDSTVKVYIEI